MVNQSIWGGRPLRAISGLLVCAMALQGCETTATKVAVDCSKADNENWVAGGGECLRIITDNPVEKPDALIVFLHGDTSGGGPSDYFARNTAYLSTKKNNFTAVAMIRPGYFDTSKNYSSGNNFERRDNYTKHNTTAVGEAVLQLKQHYQPKRMVVVGHSGGAATTAVMINLFPGIADAVMLAACPCNLPHWRQVLSAGPFLRSLSPHKNVDAIDQSTKLVALVGADDKNTFPALSENYVKQLKERGIDATYDPITSGTHNSVVFERGFYDKIVKLAR